MNAVQQHISKAGLLQGEWHHHRDGNISYAKRMHLLARHFHLVADTGNIDKTAVNEGGIALKTEVSFD